MEETVEGNTEEEKSLKGPKRRDPLLEKAATDKRKGVREGGDEK